MKTKRSQLGLSILAGGLSFVGSANAIDLIVNGNFEQPNQGEWKFYGTYNYSQAFFDGPAVPASENPGTTWSWDHASAWGAWDNFVTPTNMTDFLQYDLVYANSQTVNLTNALTPTALDAGLGRYTFSSWLASYGKPHADPEQPFLVLRFFNGQTNQVGTNVIFDRTVNTFAVAFADPQHGGNIPNNLANNHEWIKYVATGPVPTGARLATVYLTRSPNAAKSYSPDTYVDLVKLNVINITDTTVLDSTAPANGQTDVSPDVVVNVGLRDVTTQVNTNSIQFSFDGVPVIPSISKSADLTTVKYDPPGLLPPVSAHTYKIVWSDNAATVTTKTNQATFTVLPYLNVVTGPPLYQETFDGVAEGTLPTGWSVANATDQDMPGADLYNFHSDSYLDWVVISHDTLTNFFTVTPGGNWYVGTLNAPVNQFLNGAAVTNLVSTNFIFAASAGRYGNQVQYLYTKDYNLSGKTNVHLVFKSIYTQYLDSMGAVEYSLNGGATWLPGLYMLDESAVLRDNTGNIDGYNTFAQVYLTGGTPLPPPGNYGAFIGVAQAQWANLGPYLSPRTTSDEVADKRVEIVRLAQADNQPSVRFRFTQVGSDSWYFGIDDFTLYSVATVNPPVVATGPISQTAAVGNSAAFTVSAVGVGPLTYQWRHNGINVPSNTSQVLALPVVHASDAGNYDVVVSNGGGSVTSAPSAVLTVINPRVMVTGQWDFNGNLAATYGTALQYYDASVQANTTFGTTTDFGISDINGTPTTVMKFTPPSGNSGLPGTNPSSDAWGGYIMFHGAAANGGGTNVNQYTLIFDILYPSYVDMTWRALLQASPTVVSGGDDSEFYINQSDGVGIGQVYDGNLTPDIWHRLALAVDLSGPGPHPVVAKFIDGVKVAEQTYGLSPLDGRFSLLPSLALLFAEDNAYNNDGYISSVQFSDGRRPDAFIQALGGPSAKKIPGVIMAQHLAGQVVITWTGGVPLEGADTLAGQWNTVTGATSPYTVPSLGGSKFYRPKIP